jgi:Tfp pilus assembly pilus retraction ATPase PilT
MSKKEKKTQKIEQSIESSEVNLNLNEINNSINDLNEKYNNLDSKLKEIENIFNSLKENLMNLNIPENLHLKLSEIENKLENFNKEKNEIYNLIDNYSKDLSILFSKISELDNLITKVETFKDELNSYKAYLEPIVSLKENIEKIPEYLNIINELKEKELITHETINSLQSLTESLKEKLLNLTDNYETKINNIFLKIDNFTNDYEIKINDLIEIINTYKDNIEKLNSKLDELNSLLDNKIDNKIIDYFQNYQVKVDLTQSDKILEIEENLNSLYNIVNDLNNKIENLSNELNSSKESLSKLVEEKIIEYVSNVQSEIDAAQTQKIIEVEKKIENLNNQYINVQSLIDAIQSQKIFELEEKINNIKNEVNNILNETQHLIENKIIEYVTNVQSQIDSAQTSYIQKIESELNSFKDQVYSILDSNKNEIFINLKDQLNEILLNKTIEINNNIASSLNENLLKSINEIKEFYNSELSNKLDYKLNENYLNLKTELINIIESHKDHTQKLIDFIQDKKIEEINNKINLIQSNIENKLQNILQDLNIKIKEEIQNNLTSIVNNLNQNIEKLNEIFIKQDIEEELEITQDLPYDIYKLIDFMNKEDVNSNVLFIKPNNRPFLKIRNNLAALGKVSLKNGDVFNFIKELLNPKELEILKNNGIFEKFFVKDNIKYKLYTYKTVDGYILNIRKILNAPSLNEVFLPIIDISILLNNIKDLVISTGDLGSGKSYTLATIINHINSNQVKKIAVISEKIEYNFIDKESIIIQFEYQNDRNLLNKVLFNILYDDFDIIWLSTNLIDYDLINIVLNLVSNRKTVILELNYPSLFEASKNLLDILKNKEEYKNKLINSLNLGLSQKLIYSSTLNNFVPLIEVVVFDNEIRKTILENNYNEYLQYIYKIGESKAEIQNYNECLAYLVKNGKLDKEEAKKYFQNISVKV